MRGQLKKTIKCFSCGGDFPDIEGPVHRYMTSSPGCWAVFGEVMAREYSNPSYYEVHRLSVDAYAVQHPGSTDRQSVQSVGLHLVRLCLFIEHGLSAEKANSTMLAAAKRKYLFTRMEPPPSSGLITVADVVKVNTAEEHKVIVWKWAESVWKAWEPHHDTIKSLLPW